jgi:hypothetical protein
MIALPLKYKKGKLHFIKNKKMIDHKTISKGNICGKGYFPNI